MSKGKKKTVLFLGGNAGQSYCSEGKEGTREIVDDYIVCGYSKDKAVLDILDTRETEQQYIVVHQNNRKVTSVWRYRGEGYALNQEGYTSMCERFEGILVVLWHCEEELSGYHMFYIDTQDKVCRNLSLEAFNYEQKEVFDTVRRILSAPWMGCPEKTVHALDSIKMISGNLSQIDETAD